MSKKFRPGSEGAAQEKSAKRWFTVASTVVGIILLLSVFNVPHTYLHDYFVRSSFLSKMVGVIILAAWFVYLWKYSSDVAYGRRSSSNWNIAVLILGLVLGFGFLYGFNFTL